MQERVQEFLRKKKEEEIKAREDVLLDLNLYEKVYAPDDDGTSKRVEGYPEYDTKAEKWYKKQPLTLTDEEYEAVKHYSEIVRNKERCIPAIILTILAVITYIIGVVCLLNESVLYFFAAVFAGSVTIGVAEMIRKRYSDKRK